MTSIFQRPATLPAALAQHARSCANQHALRFIGTTENECAALSYSDLHRSACVTAAALAQHCQAGDRALLLLPSGIHYIAAFFGCLYTGVVAVPAYPPESTRAQHLKRLLSIIVDAQPAVIVTHRAFVSSLVAALKAVRLTPPAMVAVDELGMENAASWEGLSAQRDDIAFLQYTSGSTATPKGVQVSHGNLEANEWAIRNAYGIGNGDVIVSWLPLYHDMGLIGGVLQGIYSGVPIVLMSPQYFLERPVRWLEAIHRYGGTVSGGPDFAYRLCQERIAEDKLQTLDLSLWRLAFSGAEPIRPATLQAFATRFAAVGFHPESFLASYGLAEATLLVTAGQLQNGIPALPVHAQALNAYRIEAGQDTTLMSCGRTQPDHAVVIVDPHTVEPLPDDRVGEIWISGPSIAQGYWHKPQESAETFVERDGCRWLRSGDLGFLHQGELFVAGRIKDMLILRGQNLYPQDVERTIEENIGSVRKGRVAVFSIDQGGREGIGVAAEIGRRTSAQQSPDELIQHIRHVVADAHQEVPCIVALLNPGALPKTSSGKLQRSACRTLLEAGTLDSVAVFREGEAVASATTVELSIAQRIAALWSRVLRTGVIKPDESFFARGGNSVLAVQMIAELRDLGVAVELQTLFEVPTLGEFTAAVEQSLAQASGAEHGPSRIAGERDVPQSPAQESFWLLWQLNPQSVAYNIPGGLRLRGDLDRQALQASFAALVARHEALRTTFYAKDGRGYQRVHASGAFELLHEELFVCQPEQRDVCLQSLRDAEACTRFDLERGPLMRVKLITVDDQEHLLLVTLHHIIADGWSLNILLDEFAQLYAAHVQDQSVALPELPLRYADYATWQVDHPRLDERERQLAYWSIELAASDESLALPLDRPRSHAASAAERLELRLEKSLGLQLQALAAQQGATLFMLLLAAFDVLLYRYSGQSDIRIGAPFARRGRPEVQRLIGVFINTLVLRAKVEPRQSFLEFLADVRATTLRSQSNQDISFEAVTAKVSAGSDTPMFQVMFNHQQRDPGVLRRLPGLLADELPWHSREAKFPLQLHSEQDWHGTIRLAFDYAVDLFDRATVQQLGNHYVRLLEMICERPACAIGELDALDATEWWQLRKWGCGTTGDEPMLLPEMLLRQVQTTPSAVAVAASNDELHYAELDAHTNGMAWLLRTWGVGPDVCVGILAKRSIDTLSVMLSVVKAGGAYVPLDPDDPAGRLEQMIRGSGVRVIIGDTQRLIGLHLPDSVLIRDLQSLVAVEHSHVAPSIGLHPDNLIYVIHTSGSTGVPKGVGVTHGALARRLAWMHAEYGFSGHDVFLHKAPLGFDVSAWECWLPLICGSRLVLAGSDEQRDPCRLVQLVREHGVTALHFVPSMWQSFIDEPAVTSCHSVRHLFSGGEALSAALCQRIRERLPDAVLHNRYGPTETTINVTHWRCEGKTPVHVPIGRPLDDAFCELRTDGIELAPSGARAELVLGGPGLARGYQGQPALTAERFVPADGGKRLYRSGDLARWRSDGVLEFFGRTDQQVKLRGLRIETEEIRHHLLAQPGVRHAAVLVRETDSGTQVVAYCCSDAGEQQQEWSDRLRQALRAQLPAYMVPAHFVSLAVWPLTPNGKLDQRALPAPAASVREYVAPRNERERRLAEIWCDVLGFPRVGLEDDFFELGGHSLLATRIVSRVRQTLDIDLSLRTLFEASRFHDFAEQVMQAEASGCRNSLGPIPRIERGQHIPLSYAQQRMWFLWQLDPESPAYNVGGMARMNGTLDVPAFERALQALIERHESLRTIFPSEQGRPFQHVVPDAHVTMERLDISALASDERQRRLQSVADEQAHSSFDLEHGPLLRACLIKAAEREHYLVLTLHHIVTEGWAMDVFARELTALYEALSAGRDSSLAPLSVQYPDYSVWQRKWLDAGEMQRQLAYWTQRLGGEQPVLELPTDHPRPAVQSHRGELYRFEIDGELSARVRAFCAERGLTLYMTVVAALSALLYRYGGQRDLRIGVPVANRIRPESEGLIGAFLNIQVLRVEPDGLMRAAELLQQVREAAIDGQSHQDLPFDQLVEALHPQRSAAHNPLFQVMCNVQRWSFQQTQEIAGGLRVEYLVNDARATKFDLNLEVTDIDAQLRCCFTYSTDLFERDTIARMARHWQNVLRAILDDPAVPLSELAMLDRHDYPVLASTERSPLGQRMSVHAMFERRVTATPDMPAVTVGEQSLSYAALNARANRIAHRLRALGVGPEARVGLLLHRSLDLVAGMLAVLKAGGAYVPLDPEYPIERLRYMVADSGCALLLAHRESIDHVASLAEATPVLNLDDHTSLVACSEENLRDLIHPDHLAYLVYTSGSMGKPKGVAVTHGPLAMHCAAVGRLFGTTSDDRELHFYSINFDAASERLLVPLLFGAHVVLRGQGQWDAEQLCDLIRKHQVNVVGFTPSYGTQLAQWLTDRGESLPVRLCIVGGEALTTEHRNEIERAFTPTEFFNAYGPTETVVMPLACMVSGVTTEHAASLPIGTVVGERSAQVLDADMTRVPARVSGELYVGGAGLARSYHARAALSAERFVPDPFDAVGGGRLYRTGDRVRERRDGTLEYIGRIDNQVKIRGFRIELGEIEARLRTHGAVAEAVVHVLETTKQLVSYVVPMDAAVLAASTEQQNVLRQHLKAHLHDELPDYMVPATLVFISRIPLTANGKQDRAALPVPNLPPDEHDLREASCSALERRLTKIWSDVLGIAHVGIDQNFFELGGDSILSIQVVSRARSAGIQFTAKDLFKYQTVRALAVVAIQEAQPRASEQKPLVGTTPLTPIQHWFFELNVPQPGHWNQSLLLRPRRRLHVPRLREAVELLIAHHDGLRLRFRRERDGRSAAHWRAEYAAVAATDDLLRVHEACTPQERLALFEAAQREFDLEHGPLLRAVLVRDDPDHLMLVAHHLVVDGVSWRVVLEDLQHLYRSLGRKGNLRRKNRAPALPPKTSSQRDWVTRLHTYAGSESLREELVWWQRQLADAPVDLPCDHPQGANLERHAQCVNLSLNGALTPQLFGPAVHAYRARIDDLLLTALARAVCQWTHKSSMLVQVEGHGREEFFEGLDLSRSVGWFTNVYPVRLTPSAELGATMKGIKEQLRAVPHRGLGYGVLRYLADEDSGRAMAQLPQPRITFNYLGRVDRGGGRHALWSLTSEPTGTRHDGNAPLPNWLSLDCQVLGYQLQMRWTFSDQVYEADTVRRLAESYRRELTAIIEHCVSDHVGGLTPSDFPMVKLSQAQLDALPVPARAIEDIYPLSPMQEGLLLHTLLEPDTGIYFMQDRYAIDSELDIERFDLAWRKVVARHEALRASFCWSAGETMLQIIHREAAEGVHFLDWSELPPSDHESRLRALLKAEREAGFELLEHPPLRLRLIRLAPDRHWFIMSNHHILIDAWCRSLLMDDFFEIYQSLGRGVEPVCAPPPRYRDFIAWLNSRSRATSRDWWRTALAGFERPTFIPTDRPLQQSSAPEKGSMRVGDRYVWLQPSEGLRLRELAQRHQLTINTFAQAAWSLVLRRYSGDRDVVFGITVAGRPAELPEMQQAVGLFINTVPLRVSVPDAGQRCSVRDWLHDLLERNLALREHEHVPLVEIQECSELPKGRPLFDSLFVFENAPVEHSVLDRAQELNARSESGRTHTNYPLTVVCYPGDAFGLHLSYDQRLFDEVTIDRLLSDFKRLLLALMEHFEHDFSELPLLTESERRFQLEEWNRTRVEYPFDQGYVPLFEACVAADPQRIVARCMGQAWTRGELNEQATRLGQRLHARGVEPDQPVALLAERSLPLLGMMIGTLKAGAGLLSLDPSYPHHRLLHILQASGAAVLVCTQVCADAAQAVLNELPTASRPQLLVWEDVQAGMWREPRAVTVTGRHLAYLIYTSGSTGQPKGVAVEQAGLLNNQLSKVPYLQLTERDVIAQTASQSFDISVWQFLTAPLCGACVNIVPDSIARDPPALLQHIRDTGITILESVPSMIQALLLEASGDLASLRCLLPTGEAMPPDVARHWLQRYPGVALINAYGPAECADDVALFAVDIAATHGSRLPIGAPTDNNRLYVLDDELDPVPAAAIGELFIAGVGVGRGYFGDPMRTAQSFLPCPFGGPGERLYRSGDLALRRADGVLEFAGRADRQVKIRGFRIELGEIEACLYAMPAIRDAVVAVHEGPGGHHLVGYVVPAASEWLPSVADGPVSQWLEQDERCARLQRELRERLPDYMVPLHWLLLDRLPLNANGKVDRRALPAPTFGRLSTVCVAPRNELEKTLADIWRGVLAVEQVGVTDDFFQLGGHSLLATQIVSRTQHVLQRSVPLRAMFECRTVQELAEYIEALEGSVINEQKANRLDELMSRLELS